MSCTLCSGNLLIDDVGTEKIGVCLNCGTLSQNLSFDDYSMFINSHPLFGTSLTATQKISISRIDSIIDKYKLSPSKMACHALIAR